MINIILIVFIIYGLSNAIIYTDGPLFIFDKFRNIMNKFPSNIGHAYECSICFPFQLGILFSLINLVLLPQYCFIPSYYILHDTTYWYLMIFLDGAFFSGINWLIHTFQEMCERIDNNVEEEIIEG